MSGCIRCSASGRIVLHPLPLVACDDCGRAWLRDESLQLEAVEAVVGKFDGTNWKEHMTKFDAELTKRTRTWAAKGTA